MDLRAEASPKERMVSHVPVWSPKSDLVTLMVPAGQCFLRGGIATPWRPGTAPPLPDWPSRKPSLLRTSFYRCVQMVRDIHYKVLALLISLWKYGPWSVMGQHGQHCLLFSFGGLQSQGHIQDNDHQLKFQARAANRVQLQVHQLEPDEWRWPSREMQQREGRPDPPARVRLPSANSAQSQTPANTAQGQAHHKSESERSRQAGRGLRPKTLCWQWQASRIWRSWFAGCSTGWHWCPYRIYLTSL